MKGGTRLRRPLFMDALEEWYDSCPYPKSSLSSDSAHLGASADTEEGQERDSIGAATAAAGSEGGIDAGKGVAMRR